MLLGLDEVTVDRLFAQCLARFEAMQTVYEDEAITIAPNQDGCLLSDFKDTLCDLLDCLWLERCTALYRVRRCPRSQIFLASSWYVSEGNVRQRATKGNKLSLRMSVHRRPLHPLHLR